MAEGGLDQLTFGGPRLCAASDEAIPFRGVARGQSNAEIAAATYLSLATAKAYVSRMLDKLQLGNRVQLALLVQQAEEAQTPRRLPRAHRE